MAVQSIVDACEGVVLCIGPNKTRDRCIQKARDKYRGDFAELKDMRRGALICKDITMLTQVLTVINNRQSVLVLTRLKNRFKVQFDVHETAGYRDLQLQAVLSSSCPPLIFELQLQLKSYEDLPTTRSLDYPEQHKKMRLVV